VSRGLFEAVTSGHIVLTPNTELAAALFDAVERRYRQAGHEIWPTPRIRDFSGWLRERHAERQFADAATARCLTDIEERELWRAVILEDESSRQFLEPAGAARAARRARRALYEYGIPLSAVADQATEESLAFLDWNRRFEERCRDLGCVSSDQLLGSEARESGARGWQPIAWIESPVWRPVARRWLQRHAALMLSPGAADLPHSAADRPAARYRLHAASPSAELAGIAEWARANLRSTPNFRAWVCVPDLNLRRAELIDAFDAVLAPQRFSLAERETVAPYAVAGGTPLAGFAPVRAALALLAAATEVHTFEQFSALLRMPELQGAPAEASFAAALDLELRRLGPSEAGLAEWLQLSGRLMQPRGAVAAIMRLRAAWQRLDAAAGTHSISHWVPVWIDAFEKGPWSQRGGWSSSEFQAAERFRELLAALATADSLFGPRSLASASRLLRRAANDTAFQEQTGIPPIWVSTQLSDPWLRYDGLWIAGCNEERWPPPIDPLPLLPLRLQRDYGVIPAGVQTQLQFAEDLQRRWERRAAVAVFSYADPGDGRPATPSPLLTKAAMPQALTVPVTQPHWRLQAQFAPLLESLNDELAPAFAAPERTRGVATLRAQSRCAFRGFAETRLASDRLDRPVPGFNERERGELLHGALEHLWSNLQNSTRLSSMAADALEQLLNDSVARAVAKQSERRDPGARWRAREHLRLVGLLAKWLETERQREPFEVERLEQDAQTARHGGLEFKVRIDRVDRLQHGGRVLIDYKSGMAAPDWRGERPDNPQLPIYALLRPDDLVAVAYGRVNASECGFIAETERGGIFKPRGQRSRLEGMATFAALIAAWSLRIDKIAAAFAAGHAEVAPTLRACASCHLQALCRIPAALDDNAAHDD
jgi:ATP-dependent helicase/nuclease subunit B